jgi:hypothetical protein
VVSNTFERQQDACPLQGDEVRGGKHHLEVQHVLIEVPGAPQLHFPKLRAGTPATPPPWLRSWHSLGPTTPRLAKASSAQACAGGMYEAALDLSRKREAGAGRPALVLTKAHTT